jgi:D-3-phosphoglycerate dehydrogenase
MAQQSLEKGKIRFLLLEGVHPSAVEALNAAGYHNIEQHAKALPPEELKAALAGAHFLGIRSRTQLTDDILDAAPRLVAIGCFCIGTNQVDLVAAAERGIAVFNAPFSNTRSVAELVIAETILLLRGLAAKNAAAHRGQWMKSAANSYEIRGKVLGIVGYGNIGMQLGVIAESLGMRVRFFDVVKKLPLGNAQQVDTLPDLLAGADVVSLHVPESPATHRMIGAQQLAQMRPGSVLINASRGTVVDIDALAAALDSGHLHGAGIDVFPVEPRSNDDEFSSPLRGIDNAFLTPHVGGSTIERRPISVARWRKSWCATRTMAPPPAASTCPRSPCRRTTAATGYCISTATCPASWARSTGFLRP